MADVPVFDVIHSWAAALRPLMPFMLDLADPTQTQAERVPVFYSHPGDRHPTREAVWFENDITDDYSVDAMKAGRRRRAVQSTFSLAIQVLVDGPTDDEQSNTLQWLCDQQAARIRRAIDEEIADTEHMSRPDVVDISELKTGRIRRGKTANGVGTIIVLGFSCKTRIL